MPGIERRFSPKYGSGNVPSATRAATTVDGTVAACQPSARNAGTEMCSPFALSLHEDWSSQPSRRKIFSLAWLESAPTLEVEAKKAETRVRAVKSRKVNFDRAVIARRMYPARQHRTSNSYTVGIRETFQPPPSALISRTLAASRRVRTSTAARWSPRAALCARITSR